MFFRKLKKSTNTIPNKAMQVARSIVALPAPSEVMVDRRHVAPSPRMCAP